MMPLIGAFGVWEFMGSGWERDLRSLLKPSGFG